jgi:hypothetical protein
VRDEETIQSFAQYILIVEINVENKSALSNNATAPIFLANAIASPSFHTHIAKIHPLFWAAVASQFPANNVPHLAYASPSKQCQGAVGQPVQVFPRSWLLHRQFKSRVGFEGASDGGTHYVAIVCD